MAMDNRVRALSKAEQLDLAARAKAGDGAAKERLFLSLRGMVIRLVLRCCEHPGQREDLQQEAWRGVCIALEKFDPSRGVKFSVVAHWWIRSAFSDYFRSRKKSVALVQQDSAHTERLADGGTGVGFPGSLVDDAACDPSRRHFAAVMTEDLLRRLSVMERRVIVLRFGLGGRERPLSLEEVAAQIGRSKERVRQLVERSLARMRGEYAACKNCRGAQKRAA